MRGVADFRCSTEVGSGLNRKHKTWLFMLAREQTVAFFCHFINGDKSHLRLMPFINVSKALFATVTKCA